VDDTNDTNPDLYILQQPGGLDQLDKRDGANDYFITWSGMSALTLDESNAAAVGSAVSTTVVKSIGTPTQINGKGGPDNIQVEDSFSPVTVNTGPGDADSLSVNSDLDQTFATVAIDQSDDVENLSIFNGGTVRVLPGAVLAATRNFLNPSVTIAGVLDLAGGAFLSRAGGPSLAAFRTLLTRGHNGGAWNGTTAAGAINSSTAAASPFSDGVGYGLGSQIVPTSIGSFSIAAGDTLLRYTRDGDADLSGNVNLNDFNRVAADFGQSNRAWTDGDFNYDGVVNLIDFNAMAGNFGQSAYPDAVAAFEAASGRRLLAELEQ
jgi:hypothetical protein